jgi:branched-chain amino acid transport system substrate-binding protein
VGDELRLCVGLGDNNMPRNADAGQARRVAPEFAPLQAVAIRDGAGSRRRPKRDDVDIGRRRPANRLGVGRAVPDRRMPGIDAETWFQAGFKAAGGEVVGSVRMPVANADFSAFVQRAKDLNPEAIFVFIPGGAQPPAFAKALAERGMDPKKIKIMGQGEITMDDNALKSMGEGGLGVITVFHYGWTHDSAKNKAFVKAYNDEFKRNPDVFSIGGWDGMELIYAALKKTGGKADGESLIAAAKGMAWESPRGPISIDPETRDIVQTVYIRRVEKVGGVVQNVEFDKMEKVKDPPRGAPK